MAPELSKDLQSCAQGPDTQEARCRKRDRSVIVKGHQSFKTNLGISGHVTVIGRLTKTYISKEALIQ